MNAMLLVPKIFPFDFKNTLVYSLNHLRLFSELLSIDFRNTMI